jgi:lysophospholipase L1-like esterase
MRLILAPRFDGHVLRVRLSNRYRSSTAHFEDLRIGIGGDGASIKPGTQRPVTFDGSNDLTLGPNQDAVSDPVHLGFQVPVRLAFSAYLPGEQLLTAHGDAEQVSFLSEPGAGDVAGSVDGTEFSRHLLAWLGVEGVDVRLDRAMPTIVALGDSLTDGAGSGFGPNTRYPDFLAARARHHRPWPAVVNAGISSDVLRPASASTAGTSALSRLRHDVLSQPRLRAVIVEDGINDLRNNRGVGAGKLIDAFRRLRRSLRVRGVRTVIATLAPTEGDPYTGDWVTPRRLKVNAWIRTLPPRQFVDFDRILRDPAHPLRLRPAYDSGGHLHPNAAGYAAMARGIHIGQLLGRR